MWHWLGLLFAALWLTSCASLPRDVVRPVSSAWPTPLETALGRLVQAKVIAAGARSNSGFRLLSQAERAYTSRLALIDAAQKTLDLQYYAIHADSSTDLIIEHLRTAAARGVRVRILLDDFNSVGPDAQVLRLAFEKNIDIRLFNPLPGSRGSLLGRVMGSLGDVAQMQRRMHNKLFIADNVVGITGGRNLGDAYFGQGENSNFVDLDVLAAGRIVRDLSASFDSYWNNPLAYPVQSLMSPADLDRLKQAAAPAAEGAPANPVTAVSTATATAVASTTTPNAATKTATNPAEIARVTAALSAPSPLDLQKVSLTWAPSLVLADKPGKIEADDQTDPEPTLVDGLLNLMSRTKRDLFIVSSYFIPGERMMKVFAALRERGVRVRVLTNSLASNDAPLAHVGYARYRKDLLALGIELYEMRTERGGQRSAFGSGLGSGSGSSGNASASFSAAGSAGAGSGSVTGGSRANLHAKTVIIDGRLIVIGSMNLDLRSELQNSEIALVIRSTALAQMATQLIEPTLQTGAYHVEWVANGLIWRAPQGSGLADSSSEPDASTGLKLLLKLIGPLAPEEML